MPLVHILHPDNAGIAAIAFLAAGVLVAWIAGVVAARMRQTRRSQGGGARGDEGWSSAPAFRPARQAGGRPRLHGRGPPSGP